MHLISESILVSNKSRVFGLIVVREGYSMGLTLLSSHGSGFAMARVFFFLNSISFRPLVANCDFKIYTTSFSSKAGSTGNTVYAKSKIPSTVKPLLTDTS